MTHPPPSGNRAGWIMTSRELFERWVEARSGEWSDLTITTNRQSGEAIVRALGDRSLARVTVAVCDDAKAKMLASSRPSTVKKHVVAARAAWDWGMRRGEVKDNPWKSVRVLVRKSDKPNPVVTREDIERVIAACRSYEMRCLFALCRYAGLRRSEALYLRWEDVDAQNIQIRPRDGEETTKQKSRSIPIVARLREILDAAKIAGVGFGPCGSLRFSGNLVRDLHEAVEKSGVKRWPKVLQSLRAQCESDWMALGLPVMDVCKWLGHSPEIAMKHYHAVQASSADRLRTCG